MSFVETILSFNESTSAGVTKYLDPKFSSPPNSKKYRENFDKVFGEDAKLSSSEEDWQKYIQGHRDWNKFAAAVNAAVGFTMIPYSTFEQKMSRGHGIIGHGDD